MAIRALLLTTLSRSNLSPEVITPPNLAPIQHLNVAVSQLSSSFVRQFLIPPDHSYRSTYRLLRELLWDSIRTPFTTSFLHHVVLTDRFMSFCATTRARCTQLIAAHLSEISSLPPEQQSVHIRSVLRSMFTPMSSSVMPTSTSQIIPCVSFHSLVKFLDRVRLLAIFTADFNRPFIVSRVDRIAVSPIVIESVRHYQSRPWTSFGICDLFTHDAMQSAAAQFAQDGDTNVRLPPLPKQQLWSMSILPLDFSTERETHSIRLAPRPEQHIDGQWFNCAHPILRGGLPLAEDCARLAMCFKEALHLADQCESALVSRLIL